MRKDGIQYFVVEICDGERQPTASFLWANDAAALVKSWPGYSGRQMEIRKDRWTGKVLWRSGDPIDPVELTRKYWELEVVPRPVPPTVAGAGGAPPAGAPGPSPGPSAVLPIDHAGAETA